MRFWTAAGTVLTIAILGAATEYTRRQAPSVRSVDEKTLREYTGVYLSLIHI